jgi:hypothetical protein
MTFKRVTHVRRTHGAPCKHTFEHVMRHCTRSNNTFCCSHTLCAFHVCAVASGRAHNGVQVVERQLV